jgi:ABC-2 type transport system permease protein
MTMKPFHLIGVFIKGSFQRETAFRFNFGVNLLHTLLNLAGSLGGLYVVFQNRDSLNGWEFRESLALLGVYLLVLGLVRLVIGPGLESLSGLSGELWTGSFDFTLLKPLPEQFHISFRKWHLWSIVDIAAAAALIFSSLSGNTGISGMKTGSPVLFILALVISLVLIYSILLLLASAAFWYLGTPLMWIFDSLIQTGRFPVGIYPGFFRILLTWVIPVGYMITIPALALTGTLEPVVLAGGAALAAGLFFTSRAFFRRSVRKYSSASS